MEEWTGRKREPVTEERLMRAIAVLGEIRKEHGASVDPLLDSVTRILSELRGKRSADQDSAREKPRKRLRKAG
jgi:hypothetical protein